MATISTAVERFIAAQWEKQYKSGVNSGIEGDRAHRREGGYHISIEDQPRDNYSVTRPDDKAPPGKWPRNTAAAIDQSMNRADMMLCYKRVHAVWADSTDPRRRFFNAFNVWDGSGDAIRLDFVANSSDFADDTHKWHVHGELRRRYVNDDQAGRAWLSMTGGQTKAQWITQEENDVALKDDPDGLVLVRRVRGIEAMTETIDIGPTGHPRTEAVPIVTAILGLDKKLDALITSVNALITKLDNGA